MINYTERISRLMRDIVARTPRLSYIDLREVIVFARFGRSDAEGAFATCHCLTLPESEPGYYFWRDRETGRLTRRSPWFVTKSPQVTIGSTQIKYLISFVLPRFSDQTMVGSRKADLYVRRDAWLAKLDTIVHELYHIDPSARGIRALENADGTRSYRSHGPMFYENVAAMVHEYLATDPDPELLEFLKYDFAGLTERYGGVVATTFRNFPSFPQRYQQLIDLPSSDPCVKVEPLKASSQPQMYTERDLHIRQFTGDRSHRLAVALGA
ncbi:MAG TPA: hypothetical protein VM364_17925 [Vicinamibacterales bacterium]|nr:hypothetical protein [Vicinamibacterales bacterium]